MNSSPGSSVHFGRRHQVGDLDRQPLGLRLEDQQRQPRRDLLAEAVLGLQHRAVGPGRQLDASAGLAGRVGGEALLGHHLAQFPGVGVRQVGLGLGWPAGRRPPSAPRRMRHRDE